MVRPLRAEIPIYLAAMSPKAVEQAAEIGDGWLPLFFVPERAREVWPAPFAREGLEIAASVPALLSDDVQVARDALKPYYAFYVGSMGSRAKNFYNEVFARFGYEREAGEIGDRRSLIKVGQLQGLVAGERRDYDQAVIHLEKAADIACSLGDPLEMAACFLRIGVLEAERVHFTKAAGAYLHALELLDTGSDRVKAAVGQTVIFEPVDRHRHWTGRLPTPAERLAIRRAYVAADRTPPPDTATATVTPTVEPIGTHRCTLQPGTSASHLGLYREGFSAPTFVPLRGSIMLACGGPGPDGRAQCTCAAEEFERAREIWSRALGPEHANVALAVNSLGASYRGQAQYQRAKDPFNEALELWRKQFGNKVAIITDVCLCQYTTHGHCGLVVNKKIDNDRSIDTLAKVAVSHARAGADIVAPSAMMDGQVQAIRKALDDAGFSETAIMSYSSKQASPLFAPFRDAAHSFPEFGDRRSYQMPFANAREAMREIEQDIAEGVDAVIIKPAIPNLDLLYQAKKMTNVPVCAYSVSGEYALGKAAAMEGWLDENAVMTEFLTAIKRAGADMIITYQAKRMAKLLLAQ